MPSSGVDRDGHKDEKAMERAVEAAVASLERDGYVVQYGALTCHVVAPHDGKERDTLIGTRGATDRQVMRLLGRVTSQLSALLTGRVVRSSEGERLRPVGWQESE